MTNKRRLSTILLGAIAFLILPILAAAQSGRMTLQQAVNGYESTTSGRAGVPYDWSHHHLIFSLPGANSPNFDKIAHDPRFWQQQIRRLWPQSAQFDSFMTKIDPKKQTKGKIGRDWSVNLGSGATMGVTGFAAKYSFDTTKISCANDFVVFNTGPAGNAFGTATVNSTSNSGNTIVVGTVTYTWVTNLTAANQVLIGVDNGTTGLRESAANLQAAINADSTQCILGAPCFGTGTVANPSVTATVFTNVTTFTSNTRGTGGNFTLTSSNSGNVSVSGGNNGVNNQATIAAFTNLYSGCGGTVPTTNWAINTNGVDTTSPVVSLDGTQVAYVQSVSGVAHLILTKWQAGFGSLTTPKTPTSVSNANYAMCTAPCSTDLTFNGSPNDSHSDPFLNYSGNTLYVGSNNGKLHKFINIFTSSTPSEVTTSGWPITVDANAALTSPVYDSVSGNVFVQDESGLLSYVRDTSSSTTPAIGGSCASGTSLPCLGTPSVDLQNDGGGSDGLSWIDSPMVDSGSHKVFAWVLCARTNGDDGCGDPSDGDSPSEVVQTSTALGGPVREHIGGSSIFDKLYDGDFDDNYYAGTYSTGHLYACGNPRVDEARIIYVLSFNSGGTMNGVSTGPTITSSDTAANCSPMTEFSNGTTDRLFVGLNAGGNETVSPACTGACVYSFNITSPLTSSSKATAGLALSGGSSGIVIDNDVTSNPTGGAEIYYSNLTDSTCGIGGTGACAVQASQAALQ